MDWQVGDKAVCVAIEHPLFSGRSKTLELGRVYTVTEVGVSKCEKRLLALRLAEARPRVHDAYPADLFRKVVSDKREACEPEFVMLLNRIKRKVSA